MSKAFTAGIAAIFVFAGAPAFAGAPDNPGERGDLVNDSREYWQGRNGKSGWGQRVSDKANGTVPNPDGNLGGYLDRMSAGPNPNNDNGGGTRLGRCLRFWRGSLIAPFAPERINTRKNDQTGSCPSHCVRAFAKQQDRNGQRKDHPGVSEGGNR